MANVITTSSGFFCVLQDQRISAPEEEGGGGKEWGPDVHGRDRILARRQM